MSILIPELDPESRPPRAYVPCSWGQWAGIIGGLLFTIVMVGTNSLPRVASLVGGSSPILGFLVHLVIAIIVGSSYGILFRDEAYSYGSGMGWGWSTAFCGGCLAQAPSFSAAAPTGGLVAGRHCRPLPGVGRPSALRAGPRTLFPVPDSALRPA
ncbi:MAG: hypothetical protein H6651_11975 [Ardenticatenales bacterium]|nr:hypothetical protein [Ardenticatenales bacterium]